MPGYQVKQERIAIAGVADLLICSLLDRQQFADPHGDADRMGISSAAWPMFGLPWPSGLHLAARMAARPVLATDRVLEIGCGLALASLVGHRRGADMTASDCHPLAARFLKENLRLNGLPPMKYRHGHWSSSQPPATSDDGSAAPGLVRGLYNLIIGSDVLYERDDPGHLAAFIGRHADAGAEVWIVDPNRGNRAAFHRQMADLGFSRREEVLERPASAEVAAYRGRVLIYRRSSATVAWQGDGTAARLAD